MIKTSKSESENISVSSAVSASSSISGSSALSTPATLQDTLVRLLEFSIQPLFVVNTRDHTVLFANRAFNLWAGFSPTASTSIRKIFQDDSIIRLEGQWNHMFEFERGFPRLELAVESLALAEEQFRLLNISDWENFQVYTPEGLSDVSVKVAYASAALGIAVIIFRPQDSWLMHLPSFSFLDSAIRDFPGVITYLDHEGRYLVFNRHMEVVTGLSAAEIRGKRVDELFPQELAQRILEIDKQAFCEGRRITADLCWEQSGRTFWHRVIREPLYGLNNNPMGIFSMSTDISDRYAMEKAMSHRDRLMQVVSRCAQILLSSSEEDFDDIITSVLSLLGTSTGADRVHVWAFSADENESGELLNTQLHRWVSRPDIVPLPSSLRFNVLPDVATWDKQFAADQCVHGLVCDMGEEARHFFSQLGVVSLLMAPITIKGELWGLLCFDDCGIERRWSDAEIDIITAAGNLIGMATENHYTSEKLRTANRRLHDSLAEANRLAAEAKQADQLKSAFLANISHEIRTPINAIMGLTRQLLDSRASEAGKERLLRIEAAGETLLQLFEDILDVSRVESGEMTLEKESFAVAAFLQNIEAAMSPKARQAGLDFSFDVAADIPRILSGDEGRLSQILINLIDNAIKFTPEGHVNIRASLQSRKASRAVILFEVKDTGIGIAPERRKEIFNAFHQADVSLTRRYGGTGLGLAISASLVDMMDGEIYCDENPGGGSIFSFTASLETLDTNEVFTEFFGNTEASDNANNATGPDLSRLKGARALVVEDNEINQMILASLLEEVGMNVTVANNGLEALEKIRAESFSVVLMDIQMPEMDGLTATAHIREDSRLSRLPVLAVTAHATEGDYEKSFAVGMNGHITKPVDPAILYTELSRWISDNEPIQ